MVDSLQRPGLNGLIDTARAQNLDLRAAGTRILEARAQRGIAVGNLFPQQQTALGTYVHGQMSKNLGITLSAELQLLCHWLQCLLGTRRVGPIPPHHRRLDGRVDAAFEGYGETLVMLLSDVATAYVQMRTFEQRLDVPAQERRDPVRGSTHLAEQRFTNGAATELDVRQARSNLAQTEALIPAAVAGRRRAANQLCILMGMPVMDLAESLNAAPIPRAPAEVAIGIPADLLRRRPDVRRRRAREVAAQSAQNRRRRGRSLPTVVAQWLLGLRGGQFPHIFRTDSFTAFIIPSLQWNVLNYGRIVNNITAQDARLQREALEYQQAVLAGREVEDSLVGFLQAQLAAVSFAQSVVEGSVPSS